ncbi:MAG: DUF3501 family protein [Myxococcales bacterium]|nr:DUF3501 family protein [Myxococcales bacterium]
MKISDSFLRTFAGTLGLCLLSAGCIINGDDGGNASNGTDSGNPPTTSASGTVGTVDDTTSGNPTDTGTDACEGAENLVSDPGFEEGSAGTAWTAASVVFETPICDSSCTDEEGAAPYAGDWWVWFGGLDDEAERARKLREWLDLPGHVYLERADGTRVRATFDPRQVGSDRLSSVQYLKFAVGEPPVALGVDLPALTLHQALDDQTQAALAADLVDEPAGGAQDP